MRHVVFLMHSRALLTGLTIPLEMLRAADEIDRVRNRRRSQLETSIVTTDDEAFETLGAVRIVPQEALAELEAVDLLFVPSFWRRPEVNLPAAIRLLMQWGSAGSLICAVSTGSFLVAEAGLLDEKVATTHWSFLDAFAERYPTVHLKRHHLITRSENIFCAGSLNATADLTAYFIERWFGAGTARLVEAQFSPESRQPVHQQGYFDGELNDQPDELMAVAQDWLRERSFAPIRLEELAEHLRISRRSLNRRFREATGMTPGAFLQTTRIEAAKDFLRNTNLSVSEIAGRVGYQDVGHFSVLYRRHTGTSPSMFRDSVRAKLFTAG